MSRSYKKTLICGNGGGSEKKDKVMLHKKLRRIVRVALKYDPEEFIEPNKSEIMNVWNMCKDGKNYFGNIEDKEEIKKLMRK